VKTKFAAAVALPSTMPMDPTRKTQFIVENEEQPIHPLYRYAYIADREEGLVIVDVTTLTDGNPGNNFLSRALTFNPQVGEFLQQDSGATMRRWRNPLQGANAIAVAGRWLLIGADAGLVVVDIDKPLEPRIVATLGGFDKPTGIAVQFRYAFLTDAKGLHTVDITDPTHPRIAASVPVADARNVYVARTYAYVAGGKQGLVIVDVEKPEKPFIDQVFHDDLHDVNDVKVASTNASVFAYVADGEHGLKVLQLTSPEWTPTYAGFSPRPAPRLIARRHTHGPAIAISKGLDRDRAVDESGNQLSIFNRIGARPMTFSEMQRLYIRNGSIYTVHEVKK
jgi:LVIVD repeat